MNPKFLFPRAKESAGFAQSVRTGIDNAGTGTETWSKDTNTWLAFESTSATGSKGIARDERGRF
ncbi:hypothetical protein [Leptospira stimsonii]|uniref:Uncharacterized protein n=1 Tax=Leptospira stimsonii TaxID=2202203 RepID=A0A396YT12_9LEPT|nr:hypothetical protein [Leptospira stimsonii]RHX85715.1 hypothetical protein DLM75_19490 [Leptospira stimsonii]